MTKQTLKIMIFHQDHFACLISNVGKNEPNSFKKRSCTPQYNWKTLDKYAETYSHMTIIQWQVRWTAGGGAEARRRTPERCRYFNKCSVGSPRLFWSNIGNTCGHFIIKEIQLVFFSFHDLLLVAMIVLIPQRCRMWKMSKNVTKTPTNCSDLTVVRDVHLSTDDLPNVLILQTHDRQRDNDGLLHVKWIEGSAFDCTLVSFGCSVNLLQAFVQSRQEDPRQVVGFVSLLCHYQGQLRWQEGHRNRLRHYHITFTVLSDATLPPQINPHSEYDRYYCEEAACYHRTSISRRFSASSFI